MKPRLAILSLCLWCGTCCHAQFNTVTSFSASCRPKAETPALSPETARTDSTLLLCAVEKYTSVCHPLEDMKITSAFGERIHPVEGVRRHHNGIDLKASYQTVRSMRGGVVHKCGSDPSAGKYVIVRQEDGVQASYCHLSLIGVSPGQRVTAGEAIAVSGNTGTSTGPHLHLVIRREGKCVDPFPYLKEIIRIRREAVQEYVRLSTSRQSR